MGMTKLELSAPVYTEGANKVGWGQKCTCGVTPVTPAHLFMHRYYAPLVNTITASLTILAWR